MVQLPAIKTILIQLKKLVVAQIPAKQVLQVVNYLILGYSSGDDYGSDLEEENFV